jgi:ABC-type uncharacterized transport system substrate-binding protein
LFTPTKKIILCCLLALGMGTAGASKKTDIIIAAESSNPALYRIATAASNKLISHGINTALVDIDKSTYSILGKADVIITVGNRLSRQVLKKFGDNAIFSINTNPIALPDKQYSQSQLTIKQPVCRQMKLIRNLSENFKTVSVMTGNHKQTGELQRCAAAHDLKLLLIHPQPRESLPSLIAKALQGDIILATPDKEIYNRSTVKSILLSSYRKRIPVIGFSRSFVTAGALAAVHSTPEQIASQIGELVQAYIQTRSFDQKQYYPDNFSVTINQQVSHSLNIKTPDSDRLEAVLKQDVKE